MSRKEILFSMFDSTGFGLEIGPSYNPLVPKSDGYNVEILDYTDQCGLIQKYKLTDNADIEKIEFVDYVSDGRPMSAVIGKENCYDFIIASHVIEHTPDMLRFLNDCDNLLKKEGALVLAIPDKRYCFDLFQPLSTTGNIIQAWLENRQRPLPGQVFDSIAYDVTKNGSIGWSISDNGEFDFNNNLTNAFSMLERARSSKNYIDVHVWRFVPSSFRLIMNDLEEIGLTALKEASFVAGSGHEFYMSLSSSGQGCRLDRVELARMAMIELGSIPLPTA